MRPVLENKRSKKIWILYAAIFIVCAVGIGVALYLQHFKDEKIGIAVGITDKESEEEDEYNELKADFETKFFTNDLEILQEEQINVQKIRDNFDIVVNAYTYEKEEENITIEASIPYINIKDNETINRFNHEILTEYKQKAETLTNQVSTMNIIYTVQFKAYIQNNILSLAIRSEYKEGAKSQKAMIKTFNYNITEGREETIDELLALKNVTKQQATEKIRSEIKRTQEQNEQLMNETEYTFYNRDYNSNIYDIQNSKQYFLGKDGMLYIIYPYGNDEDTTEMDVVIFL